MATRNYTKMNPPLSKRVLSFIQELGRPVSIADVMLGPCMVLPAERLVATGKMMYRHLKTTKKEPTLQRLRELGLRQHANDCLAHLFREGRLVRISKGVYALPPSL